jgi:hypothetical protein
VLGHMGLYFRNANENAVSPLFLFLHGTLTAEWNGREMGAFSIILPNGAALILTFLKVEWNGGPPFIPIYILGTQKGPLSNPTSNFKLSTSQYPATRSR